MERCPICHSSKYKYQYWTEFGWGTVEQHGYCDQCGYIVDQAYSRPISGHVLPIRKGSKRLDGIYIKKNIRKRKRYKRKFNIKYDNRSYWLGFI